MSSAKIRFSSDILRRLGEELNPSPEKGILELVKNSYDADANKCTIELINVNKPGGTIKITDDGDGMDIDEIQNGWLVLGRSIKSSEIRTRSGRSLAGRKGLGRLAALRMGNNVLLTSRPREGKKEEYILLIDWSKYDKVEVVDDVILEIEESNRAKAALNGTDILIEDLLEPISRKDIRRLARELILLADPFGEDQSGFNPILVAPEFKDLEALVKNRYFQDADYHLVATIDKDGVATSRVFDYSGAILFEGDQKDLRRDVNYNCPPTTFEFWTFLLSRATFSGRSATLSGVRDWLKEFGGVHLYQNGLRVMPYGNPGYDWLEINKARVKSPEERPGTNNSIGRVQVHDTEEMLIQKTDRSGFIEGDAFLELKALAIDALDWMARKRLDIAEKRRASERAAAPKKTKKAKENLDEVVGELPPEKQAEVAQAVKRYHGAREQEVKKLHREIQLYRTLSTAGITATVFAHESANNPLTVIEQSTKTIRRRIKKELGDNYSDKLDAPITRVLHSVKAMSVLSNVTLSLVRSEKRRRARVNIHSVIRAIATLFQPFLDDRSANLVLDLDQDHPCILGSEAAIESIITNLLNNSLQAFERSTPLRREIVVRTNIINGIMELSVLDSGPGITGLSKREIWLPGETTRPGGTGLGLAIVKDTAIDLGGSVAAIEKGEMGGAEISVEIPILGVE